MSTPNPPDPRANWAPRPPTVPTEERPLSLDFVLPDRSAASVSEAETADSITVSFTISSEGQPRPLATWRRTQEQASASLPYVTDPSVAKIENVWKLELADECLQSGATVARAAYIAVYGFWLRRDTHARLPICASAEIAEEYLVETGLGFFPAGSSTPHVMLLDRSCFYQGAGAPLGLSWLQMPVPNPAGRFGSLTTSAFPRTMSFTSRTDPPVLKAHPLRPPKPVLGQVCYRRFIPAVGQVLELTHLNPHDPTHFQAYKRWQNSDRVNVGWKERGPDEHHLSTLLGVLADPHKMAFIMSWDGEPAGYGEASWNKEDGISAYVPNENGVGDWDQGTHSLVGEEKFRGGRRYAAYITSLKHFCFLREPRTDVVVGEPRYDLAVIPLLKTYLPQFIVKEVELPHKRAVFFNMTREDFFHKATMY